MTFKDNAIFLAAVVIIGGIGLIMSGPNQHMFTNSVVMAAMMAIIHAIRETKR